MERTKLTKWGLLVILLGMMVAMAGCFGGGGSIPTGAIEGRILAPTTNEYGGKLLIKALDPQDPLKHDDNYEPLPSALVKITGATKTGVTFTDDEGQFLLDGVRIGRQTLTVQHDLHKQHSFEVTIREGDAPAILGPMRLSGKGYYLLIGVGDHSKEDFWTQYGYKEPETIPVTSQDVAIMERTFYYDNALLGAKPIVLNDEQATKLSVLLALEELIDQMKRNDYLVVYFSGHGIGGTATSDTGEIIHPFDAMVLYDDFLADYELRDLIEGTFSDNSLNIADVTLIIDSCNSGSFADGNVRLKRPTPKAFRKPGYTVIASSQPKEDSYFDGEDSLFTYWVERGLAGGEAANSDGVVTARKIYEYVKRKTQHLQNAYLWLWPGAGDPVIYKTFD